MQHFSNCFVQILVIKLKCRGGEEGGTDGSGGAKKSRGSCLFYFPRVCYSV